MKFKLNKALEILERTPEVLETMLNGISEEWTINNEGKETWSAYDIVGHLIQGEKTDWIPRLDIILSDNPNKAFTPFDRFAQLKESKDKSLSQLLDEFKLLRKKNIEYLLSLNLNETNMIQKGIHPAFGSVTMTELLSTWVAHDLNHIAQISRVMAKQYITEVGPWKEYLRILNN